MKTIKKISQKIRFSQFFFQQNKNFFVKSGLSTGYDLAELPEEGSHNQQILNSRRTYTKWFNPNHFDPRTPDYIQSVKSTWEEEPTREDMGTGKI